jgi:hypothetical protein
METLKKGSIRLSAHPFGALSPFAAQTPARTLGSYHHSAINKKPGKKPGFLFGGEGRDEPQQFLCCGPAGFAAKAARCKLLCNLSNPREFSPLTNTTNKKPVELRTRLPSI